MSNSKIIVTLVIGDKYLQAWKRFAEANWRRYADVHGYDLLCIDHPLDESTRAMKRSPAWQKCLILDQPFAQDYERVVWIDADILINAASAPSIVDGVPIDKVGAVDAFAGPSRQYGMEAVGRAYQYWSDLGWEVVPDTPKNYHTNFGLPAFDHDDVVQSGVMVLSPRHHREILLKTYYEYEDKGAPVWHYEMRPLSYELLKANAVHWIDGRFNQLWVFYKVLHFPFLVNCTADRRLAVRLKRRLARSLGVVPYRMENTCANIAFLNSYFLHFGASISEMSLVDTNMESWTQCKLG